MTALAKRNLDLLSDDDLLRIATVAPQAPLGETPEQQVRRFLAWEGIRPGRTASIELHLLFYRYVLWLAEHKAASASDARPPEQIPPRAFGLALSRLGFKRKKARRRGDFRVSAAYTSNGAQAWICAFDEPHVHRSHAPVGLLEGWLQTPLVGRRHEVCSG